MSDDKQQATELEATDQKLPRAIDNLIDLLAEIAARVQQQGDKAA